MNFIEPVRGTLRSYYDPSQVLKFQYNPNRIKDESSAKYASHNIAGLHHPQYQYAGGEGRKLSFDLELFGPDQEGKEVKERVQHLISLTYPDIIGESIQNRAPELQVLNLGRLYRNFVCHVSTVSATYENYFTAEFKAQKAIVSISLVEQPFGARGWRDLRSQTAQSQNFETLERFGRVLSELRN